MNIYREACISEKKSLQMGQSKFTTTNLNKKKNSPWSGNAL